MAVYDEINKLKQQMHGYVNKPFTTIYNYVKPLPEEEQLKKDLEAQHQLEQREALLKARAAKRAQRIKEIEGQRIEKKQIKEKIKDLNQKLSAEVNRAEKIKLKKALLDEEERLKELKHIDAENSASAQYRAKLIRNAIGSQVNIHNPQFQNSPIGKIAHLNGLNPEGIAFGMLFEELLFFIRFGTTAVLGSYAPGSFNQESMQFYNSLDDDLRYDPANPGDKPIYKYNIVRGVPKGILEDDHGNYIEIRPKDVTLFDIMANGYFPMPTRLESMRQELDYYIGKILGTDPSPSHTNALRALYDKWDNDAAKGKRHDDASDIVAMHRPAPAA